MNIEIMSASKGKSPFETEKTPKAKDTDKYPRHMGMPSENPFLKREEFIEDVKVTFR